MRRRTRALRHRQIASKGKAWPPRLGPLRFPIRQAEEESADLSEKLANESEKLALLQKYVEARKNADTEKQRLSAQMTSAQAEQQRLSLQLASEQKIAAAQLATAGSRVDVPDHLRLDVIDAAKECPGDCIHVLRAADQVEVAGPDAAE